MQKKLLKNITGDLLYSIAAMSVLNGVLQLVIYPFMNRYMGSSNAGNAISLMSIVAIVGASFGSSANHSRLIRRIHYEVSNGDFNIFLLISAMIAAGVAVVATIIFSNTSSWRQKMPPCGNSFPRSRRTTGMRPPSSVKMTAFGNFWN